MFHWTCRYKAIPPEDTDLTKVLGFRVCCIKCGKSRKFVWLPFAEPFEGKLGLVMELASFEVMR